MNRIYFLCASLLFLISGHVAGEVASYIDKQNRWIPVHLQRAFEAGCKQVNKVGCKEAANLYRKEQDRIYN